MRFLLLFLVCFSAGFGETLSFDVHGEGAALLNGDTGQVLYEKNKDKPLFPASITKVVTAFYILKYHGDRLNDKVVAKKEALASITPQAKKQSNYRSPPHWLETDGSHMGIKVGEEFILKDLLIGMLIASANDASNVMAEHLEGSIPLFMEKLNKAIKEIGCQQSYFCNPHGLPHPHQKTTAYEMALIAKEAMKFPIFRDIVKLTSYTCPKTNLSQERKLVQTNHLLRSSPYFYSKAIGIKTGTTSQAGKTLVAAARNDERYLVGVVLQCKSIQERYHDMIKMFDKAFSEKKMRLTLLPKGVQQFTVKIPHGRRLMKVGLKEPFYYDFFPTEKKEVKIKAVVTKTTLPIEKDECIGSVLALNSQGGIVGKIPLFAEQRVSATWFYKVKQTLLGKSHIFLKALLVVALALLFLFIKKGRRKKRRVGGMI